MLLALVLAKTETQTFWGEKEYTVLEPSNHDFSYLGIIVYAQEIGPDVVVTNDVSNMAVD